MYVAPKKLVLPAWAAGKAKAKVVLSGADKARLAKVKAGEATPNRKREGRKERRGSTEESESGCEGNRRDKGKGKAKSSLDIFDLSSGSDSEMEDGSGGNGGRAERSSTDSLSPRPVAALNGEGAVAHENG